MEAYGYAIADATKALELDPANVKVYTYRAFYQWYLVPDNPEIGILAKSIGQHRHSEPSRCPQRFQIRHQTRTEQPDREIEAYRVRKAGAPNGV